MMKKLAFFVEGYTEQIMIARYIKEVFSPTTIAISSIKIKGGTSVPISFTTICADSITEKTKFYIMVYNCGGESNIKSYIEKHKRTLIKQGFSKIVGVRDVYPNVQRSDIHKLRRGLYYKMPQADIRTDFVLNIMEIEAWFLSDHSHFEKINPGLSSGLIKSSLNLDLQNENMELRDSPACDLKACYELVGESYTKDPEVIKRTVNSIDCVELYHMHMLKLSGLKQLHKELEEFLV